MCAGTADRIAAAGLGTAAGVAAGATTATGASVSIGCAFSFASARATGPERPYINQVGKAMKAGI